MQVYENIGKETCSQLFSPGINPGELEVKRGYPGMETNLKELMSIEKTYSELQAIIISKGHIYYISFN